MSQVDERELSSESVIVIDALLAAIKKDDWTRIDAAWDRTRKPRGIHIRRDTSMDEDTFLRDAVSDAQRRGILPVFVKELIFQDLLTDSDLHAISRLPDGPFWGLQTFHNGTFLPINALLEGKNLIAACDHVCRIDIDRCQVGTGVQIAPALVATSAHVVKKLTTAAADGLLQEDSGSLGKLSVTFGYAEDFKDEESTETERNLGEAVALHHRWLAWGSGLAVSDDPDSRLGIESIFGIKDPEGPWDIAFIRLAAPRPTRRPIRLLDSAPPAKPFQINVLHHPHSGATFGQPLLLSRGVLRKHIGDPPVRCLHDADTSEGSSGAPVFDSQWRVVALHQGGSTPTGKNSTGAENRAVPVGRWLAQVAAIERSHGEGIAYLNELTTATDLAPYPYPVIGRRETQRRVLRAMRPEASAEDRLIIVRGERGTGRRFTKRLVREMLTRAGAESVAAMLDMANALDDSPTQFIERIAGAFSVEWTISDRDLLTTEPRVIRDDLVPRLGQLLDNVGGVWPVWLVFEGFGDVSAQIPMPLTDMIAALAERLADFPSLRLVLVGWASTPPCYESSVEELQLPTPDDVIFFLHPKGDWADSETVRAVEADFAFAAKLNGVSYPYAMRKALEMHEMLRPQIEPGDRP